MADSADDATRQFTLLELSARAAPGLLTRAGWEVLTDADLVIADVRLPLISAAVDELVTDWPLPIRSVPLPWADREGVARAVHVEWSAAPEACRVVLLCPAGTGARLASALDALPVRDPDPDPDPDPAKIDDRPICSGAARRTQVRVVAASVVAASTDRPGAGLLELVDVMDQLRSPGGCPWDAEQTHESLVPYLVEETYELVEAIESGQHPHIAEELGDVLLQVVFHARVAQEHPSAAFDIDDVAGMIVAKLRRRHPHVFADVHARTPEQVAANWAAIKAAEKPERSGPLDGIPTALPALERATKMVNRLDSVGLLSELVAAESVPDRRTPTSSAAPQSAASEIRPDTRSDVGSDLGGDLLALVVGAHRSGQDPSAALRAALADLEHQIRNLPSTLDGGAG